MKCDCKGIRLTRRSFFNIRAGICLAIGITLLMACAAPATPTATPSPTVSAPKPAATSAAAPTTAPTAAPAAAPTTAAPKAATPAAAAPKALRPVKLAVAAGAMLLATGLIEKMKFDEKYGLKLDMRSMDPTATEKAIALGQLDAGPFSLVAAANFTNEDIPIVEFGPIMYNHISAIVWKDSPYQTMADLKGKKIATPDRAGGAYTNALILAKEMGDDFEKDYQVITGPVPALPPYLERKDVEAILINEPTSSNLVLTGKYRRLMAYTDEWQKLTGQPMFMNGLGARRSWVEQNRDTASALAKMIMEVHGYIRKNPGVFEEFQKALNLTTPEQVKMAQERMPTIYPDRWDDKLVQNAKHIVDRAIELNVIKAPKQDIFMVLP
ncbi:MAG: ABC transporter substrate-binding protein [Chloroflexi bacterium]|nr:ABC transporter substrate-binding protein [Chloroflexota bacterium]